MVPDAQECAHCVATKGMDPCERAHFEQERSRSVHAAERLRAAGLPCREVSIGSTPTALSFENLDGITEVRAGVYVFFDLVMPNVGVCSLSEIALSVLTTVIGHQEEKGWAIVEVGWMAMSHDRGTQRLGKDFGYGQVCTVNGEVLADYLVNSANQEHGTRCTEDAQREPHLCVSGHMTSFASSA